MNKTALIPIADGTEELEAVTLIDVLRRAGTQVTVGAVRSLQITASRKVKLQADRTIEDCLNSTFDLIALPGGLPGAEYLRDCPPLIEMLREQKNAGRLYAAICASPAVVLAAHGLLDDKQATGYPTMLEHLPHAAAIDQRVVADGNCITSQGPGTAIAFAIELVRQLFDKTRAAQVAEAMLVSA